jgi:cell wall-associated NlpC family hydrolase
MRIRLLIPLAAAIALTALCAGRVGAAPPAPTDKAGTKAKKAIAAKQAEARQVLAEIAAIDEQLNMVSEQFDGARVRLQTLRKNLVVEQKALTTAQARYRRAMGRAAKLAVWLYTSNHSSSLDVILGARDLGELLRLSDAEHQLSVQAAFIANETAAAKRNLELRVRILARDRKAAAATVRELATVRAKIMSGLAERQKLLASVQGEVHKLEAAERARQARLAALARARLEAQLAAQRKAAAEAAAAAKRAQLAEAARARAAAAAAAARATAAAPAATTATPPQTPIAAITTTSTTDPVVTPTVPAPVVTTTTPIVTTTPVYTGPLPAGHPEAAQLALAYLGVPYVWGGSVPTGFDCSGLVTYVYAQLGIALPHFAAAQWEYGVPVPLSELQAGDLVFFDKLDHVGIYLGDSLFIDAPHTGAFVRIDSLGERWYGKKYVGARRI